MNLILIGLASYYSIAGCLGCNPNFTMANGERLDDSKLTVALTPQVVRKYNLLNKFVLIKNPKNKLQVKVKVTDTGGFGYLDRVADLSLATKQALKCQDLCQVKISIKGVKND